MDPLRRYRKRRNTAVTAVQLRLDTPGLEYHKWGSVQHAKAGDWLVDNDGDVYTVDAGVFERTYRAMGPGRYAKVNAVLARPAEEAGCIETKEGNSRYRRGDYLVYNEADGGDGYCMPAETFHTLYEPDEDQ